MDIIPVNYDVAEMNTHAEADGRVVGHVRVARHHAVLHGHGALYGRDHTGKFEQQTIAHCLDDSPAMLGDFRVNQLSAVSAQRFERSDFV